MWCCENKVQPWVMYSVFQTFNFNLSLVIFTSIITLSPLTCLTNTASPVYKPIPNPSIICTWKMFIIKITYIFHLFHTSQICHVDRNFKNAYIKKLMWWGIVGGRGISKIKVNNNYLEAHAKRKRDAVSTTARWAINIVGDGWEMESGTQWLCMWLWMKGCRKNVTDARVVV